MTRRERMLAAIRHQPVDRVPFATYNFHPFSAAHAEDPSYAGLLELVREKAGVYCKSRCAAVGKGPDAGATTREETPDGHVIANTVIPTPKGDLRSVLVKPPGQPAYVTEHFVKTDADIEKYLSLPHEVAEYDASPATEMVAKLGGMGLVMVGYGDPMHIAARLFDFNDFAIRCATDLRSVKRVVDFAFERLAADLGKMLQACAGLEVGFMTGGPELCTPPLMPPRLFRELVTPYQKELVAKIHEAGFFSGIHCHGRVRHVLDDMLEIGPDYLEPVEPPPQGDITLAELRERTAGRMCLIGHIQDQELHTAPPGSMARRVEEIARVVDRGTGYILSPTCTPFQHPATDTYVRNYAEWIEAADRLL